MDSQLLFSLDRACPIDPLHEQVGIEAARRLLESRPRRLWNRDLWARAIERDTSALRNRIFFFDDQRVEGDSRSTRERGCAVCSN